MNLHLVFQTISFVVVVVLFSLSLLHAEGSDLSGLKEGKALYHQYCGECHGLQKDGTGSLGPLLEQGPANLNSHMTQSKSDEELFIIIKQGGGVEMHGWADTLRDDEIRSLVGYIRHSNP